MLGTSFNWLVYQAFTSKSNACRNLCHALYISSCCRYHRAAIAFNTHIGIESQSRHPSQQTSEDIKKAAWNWVQVNRAEVASAALKAVQGHLPTDDSTQATQPKETDMGKRLRSPDGVQPEVKLQAIAVVSGNVSSGREESVVLVNPKPNQSQGHVSISGAGSALSQCLPAAAGGGGNASEQLSFSAAHGSGIQLSALQASTLDRLQSAEAGARVLIVQPCCTGKSQYYVHFAKQPNTILIIAQPFVSLKQQTASDAAKEQICTSIQKGVPLKNLVVSTGLMIMASYERLHCLIMLVKQAIAEGVRVVVCVDEVHVLLDSVAVSGYRKFQAMWTFMAALESYGCLLFATSATVRPRCEIFMAQELGFEAWR